MSSVVDPTCGLSPESPEKKTALQCKSIRDPVCLVSGHCLARRRHQELSSWKLVTLAVHSDVLAHLPDGISGWGRLTMLCLTVG